MLHCYGPEPNPQNALVHTSTFFRVQNLFWFGPIGKVVRFDSKADASVPRNMNRWSSKGLGWSRLALFFHQELLFCRILRTVYMYRLFPFLS